MNILFVCTGNISRSYLASMLLQDKVREKSLKNILVESAGTSAYPGSSGDPEMVKYLSDIEVPFIGHFSRQIQEEHVIWADLILVMEKMHRSIIEEQWPFHKTKVELLAKYISPDTIEDDIPDPYGGAAHHYRLAQTQISIAVKNLIKRLITEQNA